MSKQIRRVLTVLIAIVMLGSSAKVIYDYIQHRSGAESYAEAETLSGASDLSGESPTPLTDLPLLEDTLSQSEEVKADPLNGALSDLDLAALRQTNPDVQGWIIIPDTQLSYPLLHGTDNSYYLNHTWNKVRSSVGSIFMERRNASDLSDFNTIIYGHRMLDLSMFGSLKKYNKQDHWQAHPEVYIVNDTGTHRYAIFSAYEAGVSDDTYRLIFENEEEKQRCIDFYLKKSVIQTDIVPTVSDRILTLSTCTGRGYQTRWVVQAVLQESIPS